MKILILYTKDRKEVFNRKSAIGSYINCLGHLLSDDNEVFLNGVLIPNGSFESNFNNEEKNINSLKKFVPKLIKNFLKEFRLFRNLKTFKKELLSSTNKYDKILEFYNLGSDLGYCLSKQQKCELLITYDGPILEEYFFFNNRQPIFKKIISKREKLSLLHASKIVVYSNPMRDYITKLTNRKAGVFIHQNVDFTRFDVLEEKKMKIDQSINICFIGSFLKWHQVELLVEAFINCLEKGLNLKLFLVGDGMERKTIENLVSLLDNGIRSKITFTGFLDGEELFELKKDMHLGIMPGSNWYGAPNKIFEYGAMRMAVIAPDTPTILDLFTENEVCFFEWKNLKSLENKMLHLLNNPSLIKKYSEVLNTKILNTYNSANTVKFYIDLISA